LEWDDL